MFWEVANYRIHCDGVRNVEIIRRMNTFEWIYSVLFSGKDDYVRSRSYKTPEAAEKAARNMLSKKGYSVEKERRVIGYELVLSHLGVRVFVHEIKDGTWIIKANFDIRLDSKYDSAEKAQEASIRAIHRKFDVLLSWKPKSYETYIKGYGRIQVNPSPSDPDIWSYTIVDPDGTWHYGPPRKSCWSAMKDAEKRLLG